MYLLKKEIRNVGADVVFVNGSIFFIQSAIEYLFEIGANLDEIKVSNDKFSYLFNCNNLLHKKDNIFIDTNSLKEMTLDFSAVSLVSDITFLIRSGDSAIFKNVDIEKEEVKYYLLNKNNKVQILNSNITFPKYLNSYFVFCVSRNILTCHSLSTGEEKWRTDIGSIMNCEHFSIYGDIHEFNGKLYFFVAERHTDNKATLCIDIETGELIRKLDNYLGWLYLANDHFYIVSDTAISILNPDTFAIEDIDVSAIMKEYDWIIAWDKFVVKDQYLYFTTMNIGSQTAPSVGVIDMQERKLLWSQAIAVEQSWQNVSELRVQDKRLYVLTHDNTLHIFEEDTM